jgi:hypothetical protein
MPERFAQPFPAGGFTANEQEIATFAHAMSSTNPTAPSAQYGRVPRTS